MQYNSDEEIYEALGLDKMTFQPADYSRLRNRNYKSYHSEFDYYKKHHPDDDIDFVDWMIKMKYEPANSRIKFTLNLGD